MDQSSLENPVLTVRQAAFVSEYVVDLNGAQAAIRAGFSEKGSRNVANRLLANRHIRSAIGKLMDKRGERLQVTADRVLEELAKIAFSDIRLVSSWNTRGVTIVPSDEIDDHTAAAISEVSEKTTETDKSTSTNIRVKMHDKLKALDMLARHLGMMKGDDPEGDRFKNMPIGELIKFVTTQLQIPGAPSESATARPGIQQPMHAGRPPHDPDPGSGSAESEGEG